MSNILSINSGEGQGCVLAATLYNICQSYHPKLVWSNTERIKVIDLDFADNVFRDEVCYKNVFSLFMLGVRASKLHKALHILVVICMSLGCQIRKSVDRLAWQQVPLTRLSIWSCWYLYRRIKLYVSKALILLVLLGGTETWTFICTLESSIDAFCNRSLHLTFE